MPTIPAKLDVDSIGSISFVPYFGSTATMPSCSNNIQIQAGHTTGTNTIMHAIEAKNVLLKVGSGSKNPRGVSAGL